MFCVVHFDLFPLTNYTSAYSLSPFFKNNVTEVPAQDEGDETANIEDEDADPVIAAIPSAAMDYWHSDSDKYNALKQLRAKKVAR